MVLSVDNRAQHKVRTFLSRLEFPQRSSQLVYYLRALTRTFPPISF